jgi:phospholipase C
LDQSDCTLRNGPAWNDTLLIITYDEHGGNYDHVPPPWGAVPPDNANGEFGFDFTRFGVRIPALLISPRIAAGTVFRAKRGTIDHTSVLRTLGLRWGLDPLSARDRAAADLGDVLTLAVPRADDPLKGVQPPVSNSTHPYLSQPSALEKIHAARVADLPVRNDQGAYDHHTPPDISTTAAIGDYIQSRTAAWKEHLQRVRRRRLAAEANDSHDQRTTRDPPPPANRGGRKPK